jgi:hypothetical protein
MIKTLTAMRYVAPLWQGSSLPAIVEAEDGALYVMKFLGAGQGSKALIAELLAGEIARRLGLPVPEIVLLDLDAELGRLEAHPEISALLGASEGRNLGLRFLEGATSYDRLLEPPDAGLASRIVWFDAYVTNVDRTPRNVNLLLWRQRLWLIDHGAALYFHHDWKDYLARSRSPFPRVQDHVLLPYARQLAAADAELRPLLTDDFIARLVAAIPDVWLDERAPFSDAAAHRRAYSEYLLARRDAAPVFVEEAIRAHAASL